MATRVTLGQYLDSPRGACSIDIEKLIESRALAQANSGAGKSWICRRLIETLARHLPIIVLDVEGEFHTLREKFDFLLVGGDDADCPVSVRGAALLARRIMEHDISAIIRIDEMKKHQRFEFAKRFLDALIESPRKLWRPRLVVVDEAHEFAPEKGKAESTGAVIDLMARGRKRGLCGLLATQRIGKIHKDAIAEANNKFIGRAALDIDMKRAGDELGLGARDQKVLRTLAPGEFYVFGPAVSDQVRLVKVGEVKTTHPKAGQRMAPVAPARPTVRKIVKELGDIPADAEREIQDLAGARTKIAELEAELRAAAAPVKPGQNIVQADYAALEARWWAKACADLTRVSEGHRRALLDEAELFRGYGSRVRNLADELAEHGARAVAAADKIKAPECKRPIEEPRVTQATLAKKLAKYARTPEEVLSALDGNGHLSLRSGQGRILTVMVQRFPAKLSMAQVGTLARMKWTGGTFKTYWSRLRVAGLIDSEDGGQLWRATQAGIDKVGGEIPRASTREEIVEMWAQAVGGKAGDMLRLLVSRYPEHYTRDSLAIETGLEVNGGTFKTYISRLRSNNLVTTTGDDVRASDDLLS